MTTFIIFLLGLYVGLLIGSTLVKRLQRPLIDDQNKGIDYWFESYMKLLKDYNKMTVMYFKEATKNIGK